MHALLWLVSGDPQLSTAATKVLVDASNELLLSAASYWEIAIKISLGKYQLAAPLADYIDEAVRLYGFRLRCITAKHAETIVNSPPDHEDPCDRMLIAQAMVEDVGLVSGDKSLDAYSVRRIW